MSEDQFRKIERSKPPSPPAVSRHSSRGMPLGLDRLFDDRRHVYAGLGVFFLLGAAIGGYLGAQTKEERTIATATTPAAAPVTTGPPANVKVYAYTTPTEREKPSTTTPRLRPKERPAQTYAVAGAAPKEAPRVDKPVIETKNTEAQLVYAQPDTIPPTGGPARVVIVIDDLGIDQARTRRVIELGGPLTMAFLPYGFNLRTLTAAARERGHELIVHLPMQPQAADADPGPNALLRSLDADEIRQRINWNLSQFDGYVGVNNHMGSDFTAWEEGMSVVLAEMKARGLLYLDSLTSPKSVARRLATAAGVPVAIRDVFLDNEATVEQTRLRLAELERLSLRRGGALGIGHPYDTTVEALREWLPTLKLKGITLVALSDVSKR